jgi:hypothetical protein
MEHEKPRPACRPGAGEMPVRRAPCLMAEPYRALPDVIHPGVRRSFGWHRSLEIQGEGRLTRLSARMSLAALGDTTGRPPSTSTATATRTARSAMSSGPPRSAWQPSNRNGRENVPGRVTEGGSSVSAPGLQKNNSMAPVISHAQALRRVQFFRALGLRWYLGRCGRTLPTCRFCTFLNTRHIGNLSPQGSRIASEGLSRPGFRGRSSNSAGGDQAPGKARAREGVRQEWTGERRGVSPPVPRSTGGLTPRGLPVLNNRRVAQPPRSGAGCPLQIRRASHPCSATPQGRSRSALFPRSTRGPAARLCLMYRVEGPGPAGNLAPSGTWRSYSGKLRQVARERNPLSP